METEQKPEDFVYENFAGDPLTWGQTFFEKHFSLASPNFHFVLSDAAEQYQYLGVAAPRGSAKSTILAFLKPAHSIQFKKKRFIVIISNTFKKAAMHLDTVKKELTDNGMLNGVLQKVSLERDAEGDSIFKHADGFETLVLCKGVDQLGSLRGVKFRAYRPDLVIIDDLEDDEMVKNPQRRAELRDEFDEVLNQLGDRNTQFIMVGTILHDDCQLAKIVSPDHYPEFHKIIFRAHLNPDTANESSLWKEKWSLEYLKDLCKNKPNVYAKEMQNDPVAGTNTRFRRSDFRYWAQRDGRISLLDADGNHEQSYSFSECRAAIACDLAWKEKRTSDSSVIMPGLLTPNSEILVCEYISKKGMRPDETAEHLFSLVERYEKLTGNSVPIGFEKAMLENVTQWLLRREMKKRNKFLLTKELVWDADKNTRIETRLQPRYAQHVIYHKQGMGDLEHQLERFPSGTHDDEIDCVQSLVQLLQFPKQKKDVPTGDDMFERMRQMTIDAKRNRPDTAITGSKQKSARWWTRVPSRQSPW